MTWREKTVVAILLLVARLISQDDVATEEIRKLSVSISVARDTA